MLQRVNQRYEASPSVTKRYVSVTKRKESITERDEGVTRKLRERDEIGR